jgi:L-lactate dehydrogenase complex protein LldF
MTTEETHLNDALEAAGNAGCRNRSRRVHHSTREEPPSHIIAPAIHKTRGQIAELFNAELGMPLTDDVARLTSTARATLRDRFAAADVGISGVNFAIAETGTIVIVENEGNIRLTTSLPRIHSRRDGY